MLKKIMFGIGVIATLFAITIAFLLLSTLKKTPTVPFEQKVQTKKDTSTNLVTNILPQPAEQLISGKAQQFSVFIDPSVDVARVHAVLSTSQPSDPSKEILVATTVFFKSSEVDIATTDPIAPFLIYTLTLTYNGTKILQQSYVSSQLPPTVVPTNNPTLSTFLPYETKNYLLEFNRDQNIYIMHFKYDSVSDTNLATQLENAKTNASAFIKSKGVDPASIVIKYISK